MKCTCKPNLQNIEDLCPKCINEYNDWLCCRAELEWEEHCRTVERMHKLELEDLTSKGSSDSVEA